MQRLVKGSPVDWATLYQVIVDGTPWIDSDGKDAWAVREAYAIADMLERDGYAVEMTEA